MAIFKGAGHIPWFGLNDIPPILNLPPGKVKIRMRPNDYVKVFVRDDSGIRQFYLRGNEDFCYVFNEVARNTRF